MNDGKFRTLLTTRGRVTGKAHTKELLAVMLGGHVYLTRHKADSDWYKNCLAYSSVSLSINGEIVSGLAKPIFDESLIRQVSEIKYPGQVRAFESRVAIQVKLDAQL